MTTHLEKSVAREFFFEGEPYKIVLSADGIRITQKGHRHGREFSWRQLVPGGDSDGEEQPSTPLPVVRNSVPNPLPGVAADVRGFAEQAIEILQKVRALVDHAGELPAPLERQQRWSSDAQRARIEGPRNDWFVEPLLSANDIADLMGVSRSMVDGLPIRSIKIGGRRRYRASDVRLYLATQEERRRY